MTTGPSYYPKCTLCTGEVVNRDCVIYVCIRTLAHRVGHICLHCLHYMFALVKKKAELILYVCIDVFALFALVMQVVGEVRA